MVLAAHRASTADRPRAVLAALAVRPRWFYGGAYAFWVITRVLVLIHQGAWPWMNQFVVSGAQEIVNGNWGGAVRPPFPALLAVPLVAAGVSAPVIVAILYLLASSVQFAAFVLVLRLAFPNRVREQVLGILVFLLVPFNHSIHHYRDVPVLFASSAVFLLSAHWLWALRHPSRHGWTPMSIAWVLAATLLGVWSRTEVLTFIGVMAILGLALLRWRALPLVTLYAVATLFGVGALVGLDHAAGVDGNLSAQYQVHTFLDSTPESWLSPACRAAETENCRDADGSVYFAPVDRNAGILGLVEGHPVLAVLKTARSALDNFWLIYGANSSTYPGYLWLGLLALLTLPACRTALRRLPLGLWPVIAAAFAVTVLPPLSWAPPHPQYHLHSLLAVGLLSVPLLQVVSRTRRGTFLMTLFFLGNAALSVFRYTRYAGY